MLDYLSSKTKDLTLSKKIIDNNDYFDFYLYSEGSLRKIALNDHFVKDKFQVDSYNGGWLEINGVNCSLEIWSTFSIEQGKDDTIWP